MATKKRTVKKPIRVLTEEDQILVHHYPSVIPEPTRYFTEGEYVRIGSLDTPKIIKSYFNGKVYKVESLTHNTDSYGRKNKEEPKIKEEKFFDWASIFKLDCKNTSFAIERTIEEYSSRSEIRGLIRKFCTYIKLNLNPFYQRGIVWSEEEKTSLIDSIFQQIEIGRLVFRNLPYSDTEPTVEIVDGKQRLTTLMDFYLDKWEYRGHKFSELSPKDRQHFLSFPVLIVEVEEADDLKILKYFKKINKTSHPITEEHMSKIDKLIEEIK